MKDCYPLRMQVRAAVLKPQGGEVWRHAGGEVPGGSGCWRERGVLEGRGGL